MLNIFEYQFMIRAFIAAIIIGGLAPVIGIFLVVKRYSLLADTLSHISLLGVSLGVLFNFNPIIGALITSVIASFGMDKLRENRKIYGESVLALFLSGSLALALILLALTKGGLNANIFSYLFGSITTVSLENIWLIGACGLFISLISFLEFKRFFLISYDEELAKVSGLPVGLLNTLLMVLAAIIVSLGIQIIGILLVGALMVIPVLTAAQFKKSFKQTLLLSVVFSEIASIAGLFVSFYFNLPSGATIAVIALGLFGLSLLISKR